MPNTFATELVPDIIADSVLTVLSARLAPLSSFSTDFSLDPLYRHTTVQVPLASVSDNVRKDPTDFEVGDSVLAALPVVVEQYSKSWHVTNLEVQKGFRIEQTAKANANRFADTITALALNPLSSAGYTEYSGNPVAEDSFGVAEAKQVWGEMFGPGPNSLMLARAYAANLMPSDRTWFDLNNGAYGFNSIYTNEAWSTDIDTNTTVGAPAGTVGFASHPQAIVLASGMPTNLAAPEGEYWAVDTLTLENGMGVQLSVWFSRQSRTVWASLDVMFGSGVGDQTAAIVIGDSNYVAPTTMQAPASRAPEASIAPQDAAKQPVKNGKK